MIARCQILDVVLAAAEELNPDLPRKIAVDAEENAPLYGNTGVLDSLGLVSLVAAVEEGIQMQFGAAITLADERAVSQRESPFRTIGTLVDYIENRLAESAA